MQLTTCTIIPKEIVKKCFTEFTINSKIKCEYGFGWMVFESEKGKIVSHTGSLSGASNEVIKYLGLDINIIFFSNFDKISSYRDTLIPEIHKIIMS